MNFTITILFLAFVLPTPLGSANSYLSTAPFIRFGTFGYGYRLNRLFQANTGIQMAFALPTIRTRLSRTLGTYKAETTSSQFLLVVASTYLSRFIALRRQPAEAPLTCTTRTRQLPTAATSPLIATVAPRVAAGGYGLANVS